LIDEFTKESLRIDVAGSIKGKRVVQVLEEVIAQRGYPKVLRSDNVLNARTFSSDRQSHPVTAICS
jgi:transposase InsO family protein